MAKDFYGTLGVDKGATAEEIKKAYRKLAHQYHPDKKGGDEAKFKEINEAYQTLSDDNKRRQYDQFGQTFNQGGGSGYSDFGGAGGFGFGGAGAQGVNFEDLGDIFGSFFGGRTQSAADANRGSDLEFTTEITFAEAAFGADKSITISKEIICEHCKGSGANPGTDVETCRTCEGQGRVRTMRQTMLGAFTQVTTCPKCSGRGRIPKSPCSTCSGAGRHRGTETLTVHIPAGIDDDQTIRLAGKGDAGVAGSPMGDLLLTIRVKSDDRFERRGSDLHSQAAITFAQAALGAEIVIDTIDGKAKVEVPSGTQNGRVLALRGKGIPKLGNPTARGTHYVEVTVVIPKKLTKKQEELIKQLAAEDPKEVKMPRTSLFGKIRGHWR